MKKHEGPDAIIWVLIEPLIEFVEVPHDLFGVQKHTHCPTDRHHRRHKYNNGSMTITVLPQHPKRVEQLDLSCLFSQWAATIQPLESIERSVVRCHSVLRFQSRTIKNAVYLGVGVPGGPFLLVGLVLLPLVELRVREIEIIHYLTDDEV